MTTLTPRRRDAAGTRQLLLDAARRRFASQGYSATTVREIADEAGVNVALINRYFSSKEGLFEACLTGADDELGRTVSADVPLDEVPHAIARQLAGPHTGRHPSLLLLLLRSSGDERADEIRLGILRSFAERLAASAGRPPDGPGAEQVLLRAQIALSAALGIALLRSAAAMEPLASAGEDELLEPLQDLIAGLLAGG
ncbi:TetR/AcrR family transcriptional regulator [Amorphoplanes nipponensis]|uniref:TetR family transcriptional regulator n=1 Tax=Actinoplanes nipponensis TaxID=135950 RepID=A0A919JGV7_9ACTN|nr:TetR/AcrR family transcriptional regulator [Actinoplanes nipponensis]GIE49262.1 TetR family transcriptional regulator [Actinoplanes nipponensis]